MADCKKGSRLATLLGITSFFLLATQVLRWDLTITTGLSAKNLVIYLLAIFLGLRMVIARTSVTAASSHAGRVPGADRLRDLHLADRRADHQVPGI